MKLLIKKENQYEFLKLLALIVMFIDHLGFVFFPEQEWLRWIGRFALPLFMYQYIVSFDKTSNRKKGLINAWLFAIISQIPYMVMLNIHNNTDTLLVQGSIFVSLALGFTILYIIYQTTWHIGIKIMSVILLICISFIIQMDYSWFVPITILILYLTRNIFTLQLLIFSISTFVLVFTNSSATFQLLAIAGFAIAPLLYKIKLSFIMNKYIHYWFYPVHISLLCLIYYII